VRIYKFQIRIIQLAVILTILVMVGGYFDIGLGKIGKEPSEKNSAGTPPAASEQNQTETPKNTKIVCLGDSYTIGWPGDEKDSWPEVMKEILQVEVVNAGKASQNAGDLLRRFEEDVLKEEPGRVIIFAGIGDALRGTPLNEYQENLISMVEKAEANGIEPILILPLPYPGTEDLYQAYLEWEKAYAQEKNITVLDFKELLFSGGEQMSEKYSDDGKYPNKEGYKAMGEYMAEKVKELGI
jgi:acyl-CoA thioesterase-1